MGGDFGWFGGIIVYYLNWAIIDCPIGKNNKNHYISE
jgi:hypothetical protein